MATDEIQPKITLKFILKNLGTIIKMKRANRTRIDKLVKANQQLKAPIMPTTEGTGGAMEEGMIYIMFNSNEETSPEILTFTMKCSYNSFLKKFKSTDLKYS